jgi:ATP-dependent Clp protease ATP-binding subunit ClpC
LSARYITDRCLPDKAIDLIDEACSLKSMKYNFDETETKKLKEKMSKNNKIIEDAVIAQQYKKAYKLKEEQQQLESKIVELKQKFQVPKSKRMKVEASDVQRVLSNATGIPVSSLSKNDNQKLKELERNLKSEIIGQDEAVNSIIKSIMRSKA